MCGRFAQFSTLERLRETFSIDTVECELTANYNVAPTQEVSAVLRRKGNRLVRLHWGLVPFWAKDRSGASRLINARSESVKEKPSFRNAFRERRCLIVADGFYEWEKTPRGKQPWFLTLPGGGSFAFAGLWEIWNSPDREPHASCTILTAPAGESIRSIHDRMPVVLLPDDYDAWLDPENRDPKKLESLLQDRCVREFLGYPVSTRVNSPRNNDPRCIEPLAPESG